MAHFARIKNGVVDFVTVGRDDDENREDELAHDGYIYRRTSYNTRGGVHYGSDGQPSADQSKAFRKNYAGLGYTYDAERDAFIAPKPFASWILNESTAQWEAPVAMPEDSGTGESHLSSISGMKQPPRGSSKVLSGSNNHPRRLYCCMERDKKGIRVCSGGRGRLVTT
jgi:hypothetical protein